MDSRRWLDDETLAAIPADERAELVRRLGRPVHETARVSPSLLRRIRNARLALMAGSALGLVPWTVKLALSLPTTYDAQRWRATWVGFDVLLVGMISLTFWLGWRKRQVVVLSGFATGILLVCDAWFDVMTAAPADLGASIASALCAELPMALLLLVGALGTVRMTALRAWKLEPGRSVFSVRADLFDELGSAERPGGDGGRAVS